MADNNTHGKGEVEDANLPISRRAALALLGIGGAGAAMTGGAPSVIADHGDRDEPPEVRKWNQHVDARGHDLLDLGSIDVDHVFTSARDADVVVWKDEDGLFHADGHDGRVDSGEDLLAVTQAAVDSLSDDRSTKETVRVVSSGTVDPATDPHAPIELPSYTVLDMPAPITVERDPDSDRNSSELTIIRATDEHDIEIPRLELREYPHFSIWVQSCTRVQIGDVRIHYAEDAETNVGVRIDDFGETGRTEDVQLNSAYFENGGHHGFETAQVDRLTVGSIIGKNTGGAVVLLNGTTDATVDSIVGRDPGGGYPTFRLANGNENISVSNVVARGGVRGIAIITDARNVTVGEVNIVGCDWEGIQLTDAANVTVSGGIVRNIDGPGVAIWPHLDEPVNEGITLSNLRIVDDRPEGERRQTWAIHEEDNVRHNRFIDNDVRNGGTEGLIRVASETTVVRNNLGGGLNSGLVTLESGADPAARVEGVAGDYASTLELRAQPRADPGGPFAYDHYFRWNDGDWDLLFEWREDPGEDLELEFIVDRNNTGLVDPGEPDTAPVTEWNPPVEQEPGPGPIDDFEDGTLDRYVGSLGNYEVNDESPVAEGEYSLKNPGGNAGMIGSFEGLPRYPEAGDTFAAAVAQTGEGGVAFIGIAFGMQDFDNLYFTRLDWNNDSWQLWKVEDGSYDTIASDDLALTDPGTIYEIVVDWGEGGGITSDLRTTDGEVLASAEAPDENAFLEGGFGTRRSGMLDDVRILE